MIVDLILLIWMHFLADFVMQSDNTAKNKAKDDMVLLSHVVVYSIPFFWFGIWFAVVNAVAHFFVDYVTSRWTSRLWSDGKIHCFFVVIGLDQAIHVTTLFITYWYMIK